jgi:hypothetical protein
MKVQWLSTGRVMTMGLAAISASCVALAAHRAEATTGYDGPNAINLTFAYQGEASYSASSNYSQGIKDAPNYTSGPKAYGVDPSNTDQTWNMMIPGSANYGGLGDLSGGSYFNASASYTDTKLLDSQGDVTSVSFTTPQGANFQSATWPSPEVVMNNEYVYSATPRGGTAPVATPIQDTIGGLTPGAEYILYLYGSGTNADNMGSTFSLAAANDVAGMPTSASTTGSPTRAGPIVLPWEANSADYNYAAASASATEGVIWTSLTAQADANGNINFLMTNLAGQNQSALNGFQLQPIASTSTPEPSGAFMLVAGIAGLTFLRPRARRRS